MKNRYPILSIESAKAYEAQILESSEQKTEEAMNSAGIAIGEALLEDYLTLSEWPETPRVLVLCGKGFNTGDALVACTTLNTELMDVRFDLLECEAISEASSIVQKAYEQLSEACGSRLRKFVLPEYEKVLKAGNYNVIIDGIYGCGFRAPLKEEVVELIGYLNADGNQDEAVRVSIDLPSGIGEVSDVAKFRADFTYVPGVAKAPLIEKENEDFVGRIRFLPLPVFANQPDDGNCFIVAKNNYKWINRLRAAKSDKRTHGHILVLAGSANMPGAALMSSFGVLHSGAGLLTTFTPVNITTRIASAIPEAMWQQVNLNQEGGVDSDVVKMINLATQSATGVLLGPGLRMDKATLFSISRIIRENPLPLVLDASALREDTLAAVTGRPLTAGPVILTPHMGEYKRMIGPKEDAENLDTLMAFCQRHRIVMILKGNPTLICDGSSFYYVPAGGPVLARGGSGDILAGLTIGLLSRFPDRPLDVAIAAVSWHGAAADLLAQNQGEIAVRTTMICDYLSTALRG